MKETTGPLSYEDFALQYDAGSESNAHNSLLERPAIQAMAGNVWQKRILEVGCSGGRHTRWLVESGGDVIAVDASPTLVRLARERLGSKVDIRVHDAGQPFAFISTGSIDLVFCSLTIHYLEKWDEALMEFARVLRKNGTILISTGHPIVDLKLSPSGDYYRTEPVEDLWSSYGDPPMKVRYFRRSLSEMTGAFSKAGFAIEEIVEPRPLEAMKTAFPSVYERVSSKPWFIIFKLFKKNNG